jgi:hypothetical protein
MSAAAKAALKQRCMDAQTRVLYHWCNRKQSFNAAALLTDLWMARKRSEEYSI